MRVRIARMCQRTILTVQMILNCLEIIVHTADGAIDRIKELQKLSMFLSLIYKGQTLSRLNAYTHAPIDNP